MRARGLSIGMAMIAAGFICALIGSVGIGIERASQVIAAAGRAEIPNSIDFEATAQRYDIVLLPDPLGRQRPYVGNPEAQFDCVVEFSDGSTTTVDGSFERVHSESRLGTSIGSFSAVRGATTVTCDWKQQRSTSGYYYSVAKRHSTIHAIALTMLIGGIVVLAVGVVPVVMAFRSRRPGPPPTTTTAE